jgi:spore coat protein YutH
VLKKIVMNKQLLYERYGLTVDQEKTSGAFKIYTGGGNDFLSFEIHMEEQEIQERNNLSYHLHNKGEKGVWLPLLNNEQKLLTEIDRKNVVVCLKGSDMPQVYEAGRELAIFHYRGRTIPQRIEFCSRIGKWKEMWEQRIDQLEKVWRDKLTAKPQNDFEKIFIDSYPYYAGLAENAIQYLVDTEIDENPEMVDGGTVCYDRFTSETWGPGSNGKLFTEWVFDHGARDIAEWIRAYYFKQPNTYHEGVELFLRQYQSITPLSTFSVRMVFSRMLLPVHFFEIIEQYYGSKSEGEKASLEEKLSHDVKHSSLYERMLSEIYELAGIPKGNIRMIIPEWIMKRKPI